MYIEIKSFPDTEVFLHLVLSKVVACTHSMFVDVFLLMFI